MELTDLIGINVKIKNYQATFVNLEVENSECRLDFIGKQEFRLKTGGKGKLNVLYNQPCLQFICRLNKTSLGLV